MHLTTYTDYSLRVLMFVAMKDGLSTIQEIADAYGISKNHLMKIAFELGRHGFLQTVRGRKGGLKLARPPEDIGLGDVIRLTEEDFALVECFAAGNSCIITAPCRLKGVLSEALKAYLAVLDRYTLADLVKRNSSLARTLFAA
jgi:Rrf2 family nitric oxide-sensitive transcriptional repressor